MEALGIQVVSLDTSTYRGVFDSLDRVGQLFALPERASTIAEKMRQSLVKSRLERRVRRLAACCSSSDGIRCTSPGRAPTSTR